MNKILVYTLVAIMLGVVTMTAPLAVLDQQPKGILTTSEETAGLESERGTFESNDAWQGASPEEPSSEYAPAAPPPAPVEPSEPTLTLPEEPEFCDTTSDESLAVSGLTSLGVMIVPSFLVALGLFVFLKRRTD
jgi:hypothetical protein